jgi:hypothetical protein
VPSEDPPTTTGQRAPDHRTDRAPDRTAIADAGQQRAEGVVIREVFDRVQQQRRGRARNTGQQADDDDRASEFNGAPGHQLNLYGRPDQAALFATAASRQAGANGDAAAVVRPCPSR